MNILKKIYRMLYPINTINKNKKHLNLNSIFYLHIKIHKNNSKI